MRQILNFVAFLPMLLLIFLLMFLAEIMPKNIAFAARSKIKHEKYFACTRSNNVNLRNGPGEEYIFVKNINTPNMGVLIMHQIEDWANVKLIDGTEGWVFMPLLKNNSSCKSSVARGAAMRQGPENNSAILKVFETDEFVKVLKCAHKLCRIRQSKISGWVESAKIWGVY